MSTPDPLAAPPTPPPAPSRALAPPPADDRPAPPADDRPTPPAASAAPPDDDPAARATEPAGHTEERRSATLLGYGRLPWQAVTTLIDDHLAAWADYRGFHLGPAPIQAPPYTHLWAWAPHWRLRARIDGAEAIVGVLLLDGQPPPGREPVTTTPVTVTVRTARSWPAGEQRVGRLPPGLPDRPVQLHQIDGAHPVTFVGLPEPAPVSASTPARGASA